MNCSLPFTTVLIVGKSLTPVSFSALRGNENDKIFLKMSWYTVYNDYCFLPLSCPEWKLSATCGI